jgi:hypothetical protein
VGEAHVPPVAEEFNFNIAAPSPSISLRKAGKPSVERVAVRSSWASPKPDQV